MNFDMEAVRTALMALNMLATLGTVIWVWLRSPSEANAKRIDDHDKELEELRRETGDRLVAIESSLRFIPTVTELGQLQATVREINADQQALQREVHGMRESVRRIEDFLLSSKR